MKDVEELLRAGKAKRKLLLIDASRNDPGQESRSTGQRSFEKSQASEGMQVLFSTKEGRVSLLLPQVLASGRLQNRVTADSPVFDFDEVAGGGGFVKRVVGRENLSATGDRGVAALRIVGAHSSRTRVGHGAYQIAFAD